VDLRLRRFTLELLSEPAATAPGASGAEAAPAPPTRSWPSQTTVLLQDNGQASDRVITKYVHCTLNEPQQQGAALTRPAPWRFDYPLPQARPRGQARTIWLRVPRLHVRVAPGARIPARHDADHRVCDARWLHTRTARPVLTWSRCTRLYILFRFGSAHLMLRERTPHSVANILDTATYVRFDPQMELVTNTFKREAIRARCFSEFERSCVGVRHAIVGNASAAAYFFQPLSSQQR